MLVWQQTEEQQKNVALSNQASFNLQVYLDLAKADSTSDLAKVADSTRCLVGEIL